MDDVGDGDIESAGGSGRREGEVVLAEAEFEDDGSGVPPDISGCSAVG